MPPPDEHLRHLTAVADTISVGAALGALLGVFPPIAALAAALWYAVQIWESHTVQKWWRLHRYQRQTTTLRRKRSGLARKVGRRTSVSMTVVDTHN